MSGGGGPIQALARLLDRERIPYALIGAHAVNALLEPRLTRDIGVTVVAGPSDMERLADALAVEGFRTTRKLGEELASGPDFVRFESEPIVIEIQTSKTRFQHEVVRRAVADGGVRVATAEDLIVLKLIADRPKDQDDLRGLCELPALDWGYVEHWAEEWGVLDRLARIRGSE